MIIPYRIKPNFHQYPLYHLDFLDGQQILVDLSEIMVLPLMLLSGNRGSSSLFYARAFVDKALEAFEIC